MFNSELDVNEIKRGIHSAIKRAEQLQRSVNILVIGEQHFGKSGLINTFKRIVKSIDEHIHPPAAAGDIKSDRCTYYYDRFDLVDNKLCIFDTPGRDYATETQRNILVQLLRGVKTKTQLALLPRYDLDENGFPSNIPFPVSDSREDDTFILENVKSNEDPKNKIDYVVIALYPEVFFEIKEEGKIYNSYGLINFDEKEGGDKYKHKLHRYNLLRILNTLIMKETRNYPFIILTHKDKSNWWNNRNYEHLVHAITQGINPATHTYLIANYLTYNEKRTPSTDSVMSCVFRQMVDNIPGDLLKDK